MSSEEVRNLLKDLNNSNGVLRKRGTKVKFVDENSFNKDFKLRPVRMNSTDLISKPEMEEIHEAIMDKLKGKPIKPLQHEPWETGVATAKVKEDTEYWKSAMNFNELHKLKKQIEFKTVDISSADDLLKLVANQPARLKFNIMAKYMDLLDTITKFAEQQSITRDHLASEYDRESMQITTNCEQILEALEAQKHKFGSGNKET